MSKFRVKIDLSQFYDDERNLAYILVDPKWDQVLCLQAHVEKLFDVASVQFLTDDGIYIPPLESIDVIKSGDVLRAITPHPNKKKKKKSKLSVYEEKLDEIQPEKRKCNDEQMKSSTPKKKQKTSIGGTFVKTFKSTEKPPSGQIVPNAGKVNPYMNMSSDRVTSTNSSCTLVDSPGEQDISVYTPEHNEETAKGRKRKRTRKKKNQDVTMELEEKGSRFSSVPVPISSSTLRLSTSMSTPIRSPKHVHFDESETLIELKVDPVEFRCQLSTDGEMEPREIGAEEMGEGDSFRKRPKIQIQENIVIVKGNDVSGNEEELDDSSVIEIDDSVVKLDPEKNALGLTAVQCSPAAINGNDLVEPPPADLTIDVILPLSEPLQGPPDVGDIVLFKVIRLTEAFTPEVSDYICGRCEDVNLTKRNMSCLVLDGFDQIDEIQVTADDGANVNGKSGCIQLDLDGLLEKKVFRMSQGI